MPKRITEVQYGFIIRPESHQKPKSKASKFVNSLYDKDSEVSQVYMKKTNYGNVNIYRDSKGMLLGTHEFRGNFKDGVTRKDVDANGNVMREIVFGDVPTQYFDKNGKPISKEEFDKLNPSWYDNLIN